MRAFVTIAALLALACGGQESFSAAAGGSGPATREREGARWTASAQGTGPVRIGMTPAEAEMVLGVPFAPSSGRGA
jgi:hypothetical protein